MIKMIDKEVQNWLNDSENNPEDKTPNTRIDATEKSAGSKESKSLTDLVVQEKSEQGIKYPLDELYPLQIVTPSPNGIPEEGIYQKVYINPEMFKKFLWLAGMECESGRRRENKRIVVIYQSRVYYFIKSIGKRKAYEILAEAKNELIKKAAESCLEACMNPEILISEEDYRKYHEEQVLKDLKTPHTFTGGRARIFL
ncbi:hypothetical protein HY837_05615 [archaeon]|nr:hypothetical protein [archaeon]